MMHSDPYSLRDGGIAQADIRGGGIGYAEVQPATAIRDAIIKAESICNLLQNSNGVIDNALSRLNGGVVIGGLIAKAQTSAPQQPGEIGSLLGVLDSLYDLASTTSNLAGGVARI